MKKAKKRILPFVPSKMETETTKTGELMDVTSTYVYLYGVQKDQKPRSKPLKG